MNPSQTSAYAAKDYFSYGVRVQNLPSLGTLPGNFTVDSDSDFLWQKATIFVNTATALLTYSTAELANLTIKITDTSSGRALSNIPLPVTSLFGTGELPFILPTSKLFQARGSVQVELINLNAVVFLNVYLSFIGTKLFLK